MKTGIKVFDAMTKNPIRINEDSTIHDCAKLMMKEEVGSLLVTKKDKLLGIITEKDLLQRVLTKNVNIKKTKIKRIMTKEITSISPNTDLYEAMLLMSRYNIRRLPVKEGDKLVGLITHRDVLKIQPDLFDIAIDKFQIREEDTKPEIINYVEGICQSCGSYSKLSKKNRRWFCDSCKA